jgi:beta-galactosidase
MMASELYFTESLKQELTEYGLKGELVEKGEILIEACKTNWSYF